MQPTTPERDNIFFHFNLGECFNQAAYAAFLSMKDVSNLDELSAELSRCGDFWDHCHRMVICSTNNAESDVWAKLQVNCTHQIVMVRARIQTILDEIMYSAEQQREREETGATDSDFVMSDDPDDSDYKAEEDEDEDDGEESEGVDGSLNDDVLTRDIPDLDDESVIDITEGNAIDDTHIRYPQDEETEDDEENVPSGYATPDGPCTQPRNIPPMTQRERAELRSEIAPYLPHFA